MIPCNRTSWLVVSEDFAIEGDAYQTDDIHWINDPTGDEVSNDTDTDSPDIELTLGGELPGDPDFPGW